MTRTFTPLSLLLLLVLAAPAGAAEQRIAPGVKAGGIEVGGLTVPDATANLEQTAGAALGRNVSVRVAGRAYRLTMKQAGFEFDAVKSAKRALYTGRKDPTADVRLEIRYRASAVQAFVASVQKGAYKAPRNATVRIGLRKIHRTRSRRGHAVSGAALTKVIAGILTDPAAPSRIARPKLVSVRPKVNANDLARVYGTIVTVDRANFRLRLFKGLKFSKSYGVAVGQSAYPTPTGRYSIQSKQINPTWSVPNSPWAGELAGTTVQGGSAQNPLRARWMGIANGVGIHGTSQEYSIGSRASHGCIRMRVADVIDLYRRVPVGAAVLIK